MFDLTMLEGFKYLKIDRLLTDDIIHRFHLGYCDDSGEIYVDTRFPSQSLTLDKKFLNSVIFPISNLYGELIGVSARKLEYPHGSDVKYINTVYSKTEHLYGLNITWPYCLAANKVYVVEGNIDTIMMFQNGIKNVVGMLGSTLKLTQACLLSRFVNEIIMVPDGDTSGQKLIKRLSDSQKGLIEKHNNLELKFSYKKLPDFFDPDKLLREKGSQEFLDLETVLLNSPQNGLSFKSSGGTCNE